MLYKVMFRDGTTFEGGENYKKTKWNKIPTKPIRQILFVLPDNNFLTLRDYESYNHFIEATRDVYGKNIIGKPILRYQHIRAKKGNKIDSYRITLFQSQDSRYKIGDITKRQFKWGKDDNGNPSKGWTKIYN